MDYLSKIPGHFVLVLTVLYMLYEYMAQYKCECVQIRRTQFPAKANRDYYNHTIEYLYNSTVHSFCTGTTIVLTCHTHTLCTALTFTLFFSLCGWVESGSISPTPKRERKKGTRPDKFCLFTSNPEQYETICTVVQ